MMISYLRALSFLALFALSAQGADPLPKSRGAAVAAVAAKENYQFNLTTPDVPAIEGKLVGKLRGTLHRIDIPNSPTLSLEALRQGDCYRNICILGPGSFQGSIEIAFFVNGKWETKSINRSINLLMDPLGAPYTELTEMLDLYKKIFPKGKIPADPQHLFINGQIIDLERGNPSVIQDSLKPIEANLAGMLEGVPVVKPARKSCVYAPEENASALGRALLQCTTESGAPGYCDMSAMDSEETQKPGICRSIQEVRTLFAAQRNDCGALISGAEDPFAQLIQSSRQGGACRLSRTSGQTFWLTIPPSVDEKGNVLGGVSIDLSLPFSSQMGVCQSGSCVSTETLSCVSTDYNVSSYDEFVKLIGAPRAQELLQTPPSSSMTVSEAALFKHQSEKENNTLCAGGYCNDGKCVSFESFLEEKKASAGSAGNRAMDGDSCQINGRNGNYYGGICYECKGNELQQLEPCLQNHPKFPNHSATRGGCTTPFCHYEPKTQ